MPRWPGEVEGAGWDYRTSLPYLEGLIDYWRRGFDWRAQEAHINEFSHSPSRAPRPCSVFT